MTKLIRLVSDNEKDQQLGLFLNTFQEDVIINPKSEIALYNVSCNINENSFTIDGSNSIITITFKRKLTGDITTFTGTLNYGKYNSLNIDVFLEDLDFKLNNSIGYQTGSIGYEYKVSINNSNKININTRECDYFDICERVYNETINSNVLYDYEETTLERNGGTLEDYTSWVAINTFLSRSTGFLSCNFDDVGTNSNSILGFSLSSPSHIGQEYNLLNISYGVQYLGVGQQYNIIIDGVITTPKVGEGITATSTDLLDFQIAQGYITAIIYETDGTAKTLFKKPIDNYFNKYYPIILCVGDNKIVDLLYLSSAYVNDINVINNSGKNLDAQLGTIPIFTANSSQIIQVSENLRKILGFNSQILGNSISNPTDYDFTANDIFKYSSISSYLIELMNLNVLDCYDGLSKKRLNILDVITEPLLTSINGGKLYYTTNTPLFLTMNNINKQMIRTIQCRILDDKLNPVKLNGFSTLTIIIKDQ